jgi:UDP-glucuronate 4-epimerase
MRALVTGVAGFIGSQLAAAVLDRGDEVIGIDSFTSAYPSRLKHHNLDTIRGREGFAFTEADLREVGLESYTEAVDVIFHLAAVAGVRASWARGFRDYVEHNILVTQRILEAARHTSMPRVVYASSSSIYGDAERYPVHEDDAKRPHSPYGVSKLSAEQLCDTYADAFGLPTVSLRYFSVYGPRQRPDMGVHRIVEAALRGEAFTVFGDGNQVRDMTYVGDVVEATIRAADPDVPAGAVMNIAGGSEVTLNQLVQMVATVAEADVEIHHSTTEVGDVTRTSGDTSRARDLLGWQPRTGIEEGIRRQVAWHREVKPSLWAT